MNLKKYNQGESFCLVVANPLMGDRKIPMSCEEWVYEVDNVAKEYGLERINKDIDVKDKPQLMYITREERDVNLSKKELVQKGLAEKVGILKKNNDKVKVL